LQRQIEELKEAKEAAENANRAKDRFLAILSHELRTPLTPALMIVSAHESNPALPCELREDLETVRRNLELEARLIDDLLDLNRLVHGKVALHLGVKDLHHILENVLNICREKIKSKSLIVRLELTATDHRVNCDDARLQQVFWNLLDNATKYSTPGGTITVRSSNPSAGVVRVEVIDSGEGINPEVIPRLFIAFEQGDSRSSQQFAGLGLGLAIGKALVDLHGGRISAQSEGPGQGATFTVEMAVTSYLI
jgi:signal transduction histidine kinase